MRKLNKIISCLIPISTIGALAPVMVGCGKPAWDFKFGDSINCLDNEKEHTDVASYHSLSTVYAAAKLHADKAPDKEVVLSDINGKKTLESVYFDLVASLCMSDIGFCMNCALDDPSTPAKFTTLHIEYDGKEYDFDGALVADFGYSGEVSESVSLQITDSSTLTIPSYVYSECIIVEE